MPLHSVSTPGQSTQRSEILCVFAIENSARMGPHFETLLMSYIEPIIRYVRTGDEKEWRGKACPCCGSCQQFLAKEWDGGWCAFDPTKAVCFLCFTHLEAAFLKPIDIFAHRPSIQRRTNLDPRTP